MARYTITVKLALDADLTRGPGAWPWTDITSYVIGPVTYQEGNTGSGAMAEVAPSSRMAFDAQNDLGRWCETNLAGPWAGRIRRGLPVRAEIGTVWNEIIADPFGRTLTDSWGSTPQFPNSLAQTGYPWSLGGGSASDFDATGTTGTITVSTAAPTDRYAYLADVSETDANVHMRFTAPLATGGNLSAGVLLRASATDAGYLARVNLTTANVIQLELLRLTGGGGSVVLSAAASTGLTHAAATPVNILARIDGQTFKAKVWQGDPGTEPGSWTATVAETVTDVLDDPGFVGLLVQKRAGNTNASPVFAVRDYVVAVPPIEASGFIDGLPKSWPGGKMNPQATITAQDVSRRLSKGTSPIPTSSGLNPGPGADAWSAQRRASMNPLYELPIAYWPFEDEDESDSVASGLAGQNPVFVGGGLTLGESADDLTGVKSMAQLQAASWFGATVPSYTTSTELSTWVNLRYESWPVLEAGHFSFATSNHYWRILFVPGVPRRLKFWCIPAGTTLDIVSMTGVDLDVYGLSRGLEVGLQLFQNGADIGYTFTVRDVDTESILSGTIAGQTLGQLKLAQLPGSTDVTGVQFAHWAFYRRFYSGRGGTTAWGSPGEGAAERVVRVLREAGIRATSAPTAADPAMGPQRAGSVQSIVREAAKMDGGVLRTDRRNFGLTYLPRDHRYNRDTLFTLQLSQGHIHQGFSMAADDTLTTNDHTASRPGGSEYRYVDQVHVNRYGPDPTTGTYNTNTDLELASVAKHVVALGTLRDDRPTNIQLALHKTSTSTLHDRWRLREVGSYAVIENPRTVLVEQPYGDVTIEIQGWWQQFHAEAWDIKLHTGRGRPWRAFVTAGAGGTTQPRWQLQASNHTLSAGITSVQTSITVAAGAGAGLWKTGATTGSPQIIIGGLEVCTLTNVAGAASPQTFTVVRSINGVTMAHLAGATVRLHDLAGLRR